MEKRKFYIVWNDRLIRPNTFDNLESAKDYRKELEARNPGIEFRILETIDEGEYHGKTKILSRKK